MKRLAAIFSLLLFITAAEGFSYLLMKSARTVPLEAFDGIRLGHFVLNLKPNYTGAFRTEEFDTIIKTNSGQYREEKDFKLKDLNVAFFGDSFTFGHGVNAGDRYTDLFSSYFPGVEAASLSYAAGFEPEHYEFFFNAHPDLAPKLTVVGLYLGNDLDSDVRETVIEKSGEGEIIDVRLPYREIYEGQVINVSTGSLRPLRWLAKHSYFFRYALSTINQSRYRAYLFDRSDVVPNTFNSVETEKGQFGGLAFRALDSLVRLQSVVAQRGGRLAVLIIPQNYFFSSAANLHLNPTLIGEKDKLVAGDNVKKAVMDFCVRASLSCLDPSPVLSEHDYFRSDAHWNRRGHATVAKFLAEQVAMTGGIAARPLPR